MVDVTDNRKVKQLIVLGNGFDLTCGLKSQYSDFYESVKFNNILIEYAQLINLSSPNWADVESNVLEVLEIIKQYNYSDLVSDIEFHRIFKILENKFKVSIIPPIRKKKLLAGYLAIKMEVAEFEKELAKYLKVQIASKNYKFKSKTLAINLTLAEYYDDLLHADDEELVAKLTERKLLMKRGEYAADFFTFNYTPVSVDANPHQIQNIHGSIDENNTILGIDGHEADEDLLEFTKTYRLLSHSQVKERIDFSQKFDCIKFFGHSLGEADYSYFQSIFDGLDLYNAKTKLFFYFEVYDPEKRTEIISNNYHAVSKLLKHYGETFKSNPDHGKNLMHKLILEGRLTVKELDCSLLDK